MISGFKKWFSNISLLKKLSIAFLFITAAFVINIALIYGTASVLSSVRAYVNLEGLWARAQKDAVYNLRKYILSGNPQDFQHYSSFLKVPMGARQARLELNKQNPDYNIVYEGFLEGRNDPRDIPGMIFLFRNFSWIEPLRGAVSTWEKADELILVLQVLGREIDGQILSANLSSVERLVYLTRIETLNHELTLLEDGFSFAMGEVSRFTLKLFIAVSITVSLLSMLASLFVVSLISRRVTSDIINIKDFAGKLSEGEFGSVLPIYSKDEMGKLAESLRSMAGSLAATSREIDLRNKELESKVKEIQEANRYLENIKVATLNLLEDLDATKSSLEEEKIKDEAILSSIGDGMLVTDKDGVITLANQRVFEMLGHNPEELIGKKLYDIIPMVTEEGAPVHIEERPVYQAIESQSRVALLPLVSPGRTYYLVRKNGTKFPVEIVASPININGELLGVVEVFRDITREIEIERVKTEFVSIASHQLRTPLSTINWYSEILLSGDAGALNSNQRDYLEEIYRGNQRMIELVNALLNVSRLEVGAFIIEARTLYLPDIAKDVINELKPLITKKRIQIVENYELGLPPVEADYGLTRIIIQNLVNNAVKYTPLGGRVGIEIKYQKTKELGIDREFEVIKIWDTGIGIPRNQQGKIFTKLFRADNARESDPDGTGLGLYIIKSIIDQTSGRISFESDEGKGTAFTLEIPLKWMESKVGTRKLI